jgi:hypothetical protein
MNRALKRMLFGLIGALMATAVVGSSSQIASAVGELVIYDDAFRNGFTYNVYNGVNNLANTSPVQTGAKSIATRMNAYEGIFIDVPNGTQLKSFSSLRFWLHGGSSGSALNVEAKFASSTAVGTTYGVPTVAANTWALVNVPLAALTGNQTTFDTQSGRSFWIRNSTGTNRSGVFIDQVELVPNAVATTLPTTTIAATTTTTTRPTTTTAATTTTRATTTTAASTTTSTAAPTTTTVAPTANCPTPCLNEPFTWFGAHGATLLNGSDKTVWWDPDRWDVRGSTDFLTPAAGGAPGFHIDIHKAKSATNLAEGGEVTDGTSSAIGGQAGAAGVAAMRMNYQGIVAARLRNPMLVTAAQPGVVTFWAPKFVTTGHWFEVSLMPTNSPVLDATLSATPNGTAQSTCPFFQCGNNTLGPRVNGNNLSVPSLNIMPMGATENCFTDGFRLRVAATKNEAGVLTDMEPKVNGPSDLYSLRPPGGATVDQAHAMSHVLVRWKMEFKRHPANIVVSADMDSNGSFEYTKVLNGGVPAAWGEVYVNLLGVFYNMPGHPDVAGCYPGKSNAPASEPIREIHWRNLTVGPMKYPANNIRVYPREADGPVANNAQRLAGMLRTDVRDSQRWNINNVLTNPPQPNVTPGPGNPDADSIQRARQVCTGAAASYACVNSPVAGSLASPVPGATANPAAVSRSFSLTIPATSATAVKFLYDIGKPDGPYTEGTATISVNGNAAITLPSASSVAASISASLVRQSVSVPASQLRAGANTIVLNVNGAVRMDNMLVEVSQ